MMRGRSQKNLWYATFSCCLGSVAFGYMIGYSSPAVPDMEWRGVLEKSQLSWFSSLVAIGAIPGCCVVGQMMEHFGRKWTIVISSVPYIIGWLSILVASDPFIFYFGRFLTGFATGIVSTVVPVYLAEISMKENRGLLGAMNQLGITLGILIVYALGLTCGYWYLALIGLVFPMSCGFMMVLMPESPRWLIVHKSRTEAKSALAWLRNSYNETDWELNEMEADKSSEQSITLTEFLKPELSKALLVSVGLMLFQQLSGINAVMFNIVDIFLDSGFRERGELAATIVGIVQFLATVVSCFVIDKWGRRLMLISTGLGMTVSCFMFAYYYHLDVKHPSSLLIRYTPLISLSLFIIAFSLGWGPVPSLMMSEVFPTRARSMASSIAVLSNWISAFLITKNYIYMKDILGKSGVFTFFGFAMLFGSYFVHIFVPETKGKSLEDIQYCFMGKVPISSGHTSRNL